MKKYLLILSVAGALVSCGGNLRKTATTGSAACETVTATTGTTSDGHTAETSLDWPGTYEGTLPAADCPGIDVTVEIGRDGTFRMVYDYVDRDGVFESAGRYELRGNRLIAVGDGSDSTIFRMEGDRLRMLDGRGEVITGPLEDMFLLKKVEENSE